MPRKGRVESLGAMGHVMSLGDRREGIFREDPGPPRHASRTSRLAVEHLEKLAGREDADAGVLAKDEQILVAGDDDPCLRSHRGGEDHVVIGGAADRLGQGRRGDQGRPLPIGGHERDFVGFESELRADVSRDN